MLFSIEVVIKSHLVFSIFVLGSFILEYITGTYTLFHKLFIKNKSDKEINIIINFIGIIYILINFGTLIYNLYFIENKDIDFNYWQWLVLIYPLSFLFKITVQRIFVKLN